MARTIRFLSSHDIQQALPMKKAIAVMSEAFIALSRREVVVPLRLHLDIPKHHGVQLVKPVYSPLLNQAGIKVISLFRDNAEKNLPLSHALMTIFDAATGIPQAIMDGDSLTAIRTGASSGLATDLLARPDSRVLVIFGAGPQARTQLEAILTVRPIKQVYIVDPNESKVKKLITEIQNSYSVSIRSVQPDRIPGETDIICTATNSLVPVLADEQITSGVHINAIGAFKPDTRELPTATVKRARLFVDQMEACLAEAGEILIPLQEGEITTDHILGEIGELAAGSIPGRLSNHNITLFKSVGNAVQDLYAAHHVLNYAMEKGIGTEVEI